MSQTGTEDEENPGRAEEQTNAPAVAQRVKTEIRRRAPRISPHRNAPTDDYRSPPQTPCARVSARTLATRQLRPVAGREGEQGEHAKKIVKIAYEEFTKEWKYGPIEEIEKKYGVSADGAP